MPDIFQTIRKDASISYISRDFDSLKKKLTEYIKQNFPDSFSDFSDESAGLALLEAVCYAGDILNFYLDRQFNELFLDTAIEEKNVVALAKNLGYKIRGRAAAQNNNVAIFFNYPTSGVTSAYEFILKKGTKVSNKSGDSVHEIIDDLDTTTLTSISRTVDVANNVTSGAITGVRAVAGTSKVYNVKIGSPIAFMKLPIPDSEVLEITSVTSTDGNTWYEVDYLAQENQMVGTMNTQSNSASVPYILTLRRVPRRFVVERETNGTTFLRFGSGVLNQADSEFIPNPEDYVLPYKLRGAVSGFSSASVDPADFVNTGTLGAAPANTTLTIKYRAGGGLKSNAAGNTITEIVQKSIEYKQTGNEFGKSLLEASMKARNLVPSTGGDDGETLDQVKYNAAAFYAAQNRCVTLQDYIVRSYTMPPSFGTVFRTTAAKDPFDKIGVKLSILSRNSDGTLTSASNSLKINLVNYLNQFKSLSENVRVTDARIVNLQLEFQIITDKRYNQNEILANCLLKLTEYFDIKKWNIGQSISLSLISRAITDVSGVLAVPSILFKNINGTVNNRIYSSTVFNVEAKTRNYVLTCDPDQIFEIKYPKFDIKGAVIT